jgi:hypothetical protein
MVFFELLAEGVFVPTPKVARELAARAAVLTRLFFSTPARAHTPYSPSAFYYYR